MIRILWLDPGAQVSCLDPNVPNVGVLNYAVREVNGSSLLDDTRELVRPRPALTPHTLATTQQPSVPRPGHHASLTTPGTTPARRKFLSSRRDLRW